MVRTDWPNVNAIRKGKRTLYYYRVREGGKAVNIRLPDDPRCPEFAAAYQKLAKPGPDRPAPTPFSFAALIASYKASPSFARLAERTKKDYAQYMDMIGGWLGSFDASRFPRPEVLRMQAENAHRPRTANYLVSVMVVLMGHAMDLGWRKDNPAKGIRKLKAGKGYQPWAQEQIAAYRRANANHPAAMLIFELTLGTGQRAGDVARMTWGDYDGQGIVLTQGKTGVELWVPLRPDAKRLLDAHRGKPSEPICGATGYSGMASRFLDGRERAGLTSGISLHGLRKNATIELVEAGCTTEEVKAITGHSTDAMVALYAKKANQRKLAASARQKAAEREGS